jgi:hypothetical protein
MLFDPDLIAEDSEKVIQDAIKRAADLDVMLESKTFTLEYEDWDVKRCIKAVLPEDLDFGFVNVKNNWSIPI